MSGEAQVRRRESALGMQLLDGTRGEEVAGRGEAAGAGSKVCVIDGEGGGQLRGEVRREGEKWG